jgi:beta-glucosidase
MGVAVVKGFQGEDLKSNNSILAGPKHFIGDGQSMGGRNADLVEVSQRTLREVMIFPFKAAVEAGAGNIMAAHHSLNKIPCHASQRLINGILRDELNFKGFVISDWTDIERLYSVFNIASSVKEAGKIAITAGVDMNMLDFWEGHPAYGQPLLELIKEGQISEDVIDRSLRRILETKFRLGLFENPFVNRDYVDKIINTVRSRKLAYKAAYESIVLLKNEGDILPLNKNNINTIAVIGPNANNASHQLGDWTSKQPEDKIVTVLEGIRNKVNPKTDVIYTEGCSVVGESREGFAEAVKVAERSNFAVLVVGGASERHNPKVRTCGESMDRCNLDLPGVQEELVKEVFATGVPIIVILINGRPLTINWIAENIPAIIEAWYPGEEGGNAIADILFGIKNPGGKLPITFPRYVGQLPIYYNMSRSIKDLRRYIASKPYNELKPLFPFGHGITYTKFKYSHLKINPEGIESSEKEIRIKFNLKNIGERRGDEIVQLYLKDSVASVVRPDKELKGFKRITLEPGEEKLITFKLPLSLLALYDRDLKLVLEPGIFRVMIGSSSEDIRLKGEFKIYGKKVRISSSIIKFTKVEIAPLNVDGK